LIHQGFPALLSSFCLPRSPPRGPNANIHPQPTTPGKFEPKEVAEKEARMLKREGRMKKKGKKYIYNEELKERKPKVQQHHSPPNPFSSVTV